MREILSVGDLQLEIRRSPRRRSLEIIVDRRGELILAAPDSAELSVLEAFVREKRVPIYANFARRNALQHPVAVKEFVSGEGFPYLGRSYRLLLVPEQDVAVKLEHGRFKMRRVDSVRGRALMIAWYVDHARPWLEERIKSIRLRIGFEPTVVSVRDLGYRWGSCGKGARLYFHWRCILLPPRIADYVVAHELVHLHAPRHTQEFWKRLKRVMPDFELRKNWLAEHGAQFQI